jgi:hypothetical protein
MERISASSSRSWWKALRRRFGDKSPDSMIVLPVEQAKRVLGYISPPLRLFFGNSDGSDVGVFWNSMYNVLLPLLPVPNFPNPNVDFPGFVRILHRQQKVLNPTTTDGILLFLNLQQRFLPPDFLMWTLPEVLDSPYIYFTFLMDLISMRHKLWIDFISISGNSNRFLDRYLPNLKPNKSATSRSTCLLISVISNLFQHHTDSIARVKKRAKSFWRSLQPILRSSEPVLVSTAFRAAVVIFDGPAQDFKPKTRKEMWKELITSTVYPCPAHSMAINYLLQSKVKKFGYVTVCKILASQPFHDSIDLELIGSVLLKPCVTKPLWGIKFLCKTAATDYIWARSSLGPLGRVLDRFQANEDVRDWISYFVRRGFLFVGVCFFRRKYRRRQVMILELFRCFLELKIEWLDIGIANCYSALFVKQNLPVPLVIDVDPVFVDGALAFEVGAIARGADRIKDMLYATPPSSSPQKMPPIAPNVRRARPSSMKASIAVPRVTARIRPQGSVGKRKG